MIPRGLSDSTKKWCSGVIGRPHGGSMSLRITWYCTAFLSAGCLCISSFMRYPVLEYNVVISWFLRGGVEVSGVCAREISQEPSWPMAQVEEDPAELLDPLVISEVDFPTALSVAFFECRLFLRGTFEAPLDLLGRVAQLKDVRTWVVQGTGDEVCPEKFAQELVARLKIEGVVHTAHFVDAGHRASSDGITVALKACVNDFLSGILTGHSG
eukprot:m.373344 g.373344  ORF g.373344 m.373344 type:complete len:212 (+) comp28162_c0_seq4:4679-5314(+)